MKFKPLQFVLLMICLIISFKIHSQNEIKRFKWLRSGFVFGYASLNRYIEQNTVYAYENNSYKWSNHLNLSRRGRNSWEILIEPSYYSSVHENFNFWHDYFKGFENPDEIRKINMPLKSMNEYALNLGLVYRRYLTTNSSVYAYINFGPMYIDTDTERLKKGFAFSDIFALGYNYKYKKVSFDGKVFFRHVSNADLQLPNFGLNSIGYEFGIYYELINK